MGKVTHDQANLMLRLYEVRREPRMREARDWYFAKFHPTSLDDIARQAPMGSPESAYMRMVISYWEMAASMMKLSSSRTRESSGSSGNASGLLSRPCARVARTPTSTKISKNM
jgi:hypothetical protein